MHAVGQEKQMQDHRTFSLGMVLAPAKPLWLRWRCWWQLRRDEREFGALQRAYWKAARRKGR